VFVEGDFYADALRASEERSKETGALAIHAYDQPEVVAGQGTLARELEVQLPDVDTVLVATGGGGLIAGIAAWYRERVRVVCVEPRLARTLDAALEAGRPVEVEIESRVAADSLGARRAGDIAFDIASRFVRDRVLVEDEEIVQAQTMLYRSTRIAAEPGGATAVAALTSGRYRPQPNERVAVIVCGANVDLAKLAEQVR
jgi:threonine dehydratase